jgi:hypothetical protein
VPEPVRRGLASVLSRSVNITNRPNKRVKFGFETSEDAVTWTVFRYLQDRHSFRGLAQAAEHATTAASARLALWGVEVPSPLDAISSIEDREPTGNRLSATW